MAAGGAPMGPPIAFLGEGQWSVGGEFAHEQMDMEAFGISVETFDGEFSTFYAQPFTFEDIETNMFFGTLGYGICDNWDIFVRVGAADAQDDLILHPATRRIRARTSSVSTATSGSPGAQGLGRPSAAPAPGASAD